MNTKTAIEFDLAARPVYLHLEPIVDFLLKNGNRLARNYKWGENRTGFYCLLQKPLDFDLVENSFEIPDFVKFDRQSNTIECHKTWATIRGAVAGK